MATITVTIPANITPRVIDGFCKRYHYQEFLDVEHTIPNPETKAQFAKRRVIQFIKDAVREAEAEDAKKVAEDAVVTSVDTDIVLS